MSFEPELIGRAGATMEDKRATAAVEPFVTPRPRALAQGSCDGDSGRVDIAEFVLATGVRAGWAGGACRICGTTVGTTGSGFGGGGGGTSSSESQYSCV